MIHVSRLHNIHLDRPAAVLGGGPSLKADMAVIPWGALIIAANHHGLEYTHADYIVFLDTLADMPMPAEEIRRQSSYLVSRQLAETDYDLRGSGMWDARFSGQVATWLACHLGCNPVILCGFDLYRNPPPPGREKDNAYKDPLALHMKEWRQALKACPHAERIRAVSGPLVEIFGKYK